MNKLCDEVLNRESAIEYVVSNLSSRYFSYLKSCLYMQYDCKRLDLLISVYHFCEYISNILCLIAANGISISY